MSKNVKDHLFCGGPTPAGRRRRNKENDLRNKIVVEMEAKDDKRPLVSCHFKTLREKEGVPS